MPQDDEGSIEETDDATSEESLDTHDAPPTASRARREPATRRAVRCPFTGRRVIATCSDGSTVSSRAMYVLLRDGDPVDLVYLEGDTDPS